MKKSLRLSFPLLFLGTIFVLSACVDSFSDPALEKIKEQKLIVDGLITTDLERFKVTLSKSKAPLDPEILDFVTDAKVRVVDDLQNQFQLLHTGLGIYQTENPQRAIVGRSYKVVIEFQNGKKYESAPELVRPVPPIDSLKYQFVEGRDIKGNKSPYFEVTGDFRDAPAKGDYYRWTWTHYLYLQYCENNVDNITKTLYRTPCCDDCWTPKRIYGGINLTDDYLFNGKKIVQPLLNVPYNSRRPFYLDVHLYSISKEAHQYWKSVKTQINNIGGIFDNPPTTIQGNIKNVANTEEQVLGFFGVSATVDKQIYVLRSKTPYPPVIPYLAPKVVLLKICTVCKEGDFRTNFKPKNWNDNYNTLFYDPEIEF
jgi:Domain of unknown function (DUF4249)